MDLLTEILFGLKSDLSMAIVYLTPVAIQLLAWFFAYELVIGFLHSEAGSNPLVIFKSKLTTWAYLYAIIYFYKDLLDLINTMFTYFGSVSIGGGEVPTLEEVPSITLKVGLESVSKLWGYTKLTQPSTWILLVGLIFGLFVFGKIALTVGMVVIEYLVMSSIVIVLIPFMMFKKMAFVGDKVLGMIINLNMKLLMIRFLIFYFSKFLTEPLNINSSMSGLQVVEQSFFWLVAMAILGLMTMQGHTLAQALISGATSFGDSSELVAKARQGIAGTVGKVWNTAKGGIGIGHGLGSGMKQGYTSSKENNSGGIMGSIGGTKEAILKGRNERTQHQDSHAIGGFIGGNARGIYNTGKEIKSWAKNKINKNNNEGEKHE